ncbi:MAG: hypothetical protein FJ005_03910 [Chloroflexi bacterium]|nr:hypothetical protein [Chloroflexota bacterium]
MITSNGSWEEQTRRFLSNVLSKLNNVESQIQALEGERENLKAEAKAWEMALDSYLKHTGRKAAGEPEWIKSLANLTHKQRLVTIAQNSGGKIKASEATDILYTKGFTKAKKRTTAYSMVQRFLIEMATDGKLEKIAPGEYRLIGAQQALLR